jgi:hypothetical protein
MEPTKKDLRIETLLSLITGSNRVIGVASGICRTCGGDAESFRDEISEQEFCISGMCQTCQDGVFGSED